jgi:hypothetical protein
MSDDELKQLQAHYAALFDVGERFRDELAKQLRHLIIGLRISLAVPIESRSKNGTPFMKNSRSAQTYMI